MKVLALDIGDRWTGIAISDYLGMVARPLDTVDTDQLMSSLSSILATEPINTIVVGLPRTLRGTYSAQTDKTVALYEQLKNSFSQITWVLWDERLTSKQAATIARGKTKEAKHREHAIAAALILSAYLDYRHYHQSNQPDNQ